MARARGPGAFASPSLAFFPPLLRGMRKRERRKRVRSPACFGPKHSSAAAAAAATGRETRVRAPCARLMALRALPWRRKPHRITSAPRRKAHLSWKNIIRTARERERRARCAVVELGQPIFAAAAILASVASCAPKTTWVYVRVYVPRGKVKLSSSLAEPGLIA